MRSGPNCHKKANVKKQNNNTTDLLMAGGLIAAIAAYVAFVYLPRHREIDEKLKEVEQKTEFVESSHTLQPIVAQTEQQLHETNEVVNQWMKRSPQGGDFSAVFKGINQHIESSGTATSRFDPQPTIEMPAVNLASVSLGVSGTLPELALLLGRMERMPQTVWLERIELVAPRPGETQVRCEASVLAYSSNLGQVEASDKRKPILPIIGKILIRSMLPDSR